MEEHLGPAHRGGLGAARDARAHRAERALGRRQGPRRVRHADELPEPVAGRHAGGCATSWTTSGSPPTRSSRRCAERRADFLRNALARARDAIAAFDAKDAFRIPAAQRDAAGAARLAALLVEHGVEVRAAANGDVYVPLAQPYGRFVLRDADAAALSRDEARRRQGDRAPVRRRGLDAAADDGRGRRAHDAACGARPVEGRDADAGDGRCGRRSRARQPRDRAARERGPAWRPGSHRPRGVERGRPRVAGGHGVPRRRRGQGRGAEGRSRPVVERRFGAARPRRSRCARRGSASTSPGRRRWTRAGRASCSSSTASSRRRSTTRPSAPGSLNAAYDAIVLPDVTKEVIATGKPRRDDGAMRYFPELPAGVRGRAREGGRRGAQGLRREGRHARGALVVVGVRDRRAGAAGAQRARARLRLRGRGLAAARPTSPAIIP